jgi:chromosome segregation ATPase
MKTRALLALLVWASASIAHAQTLEDRLRSQLVAVTNQLHDLQAKQAAQPAAASDAAQLNTKLAAAEAEIRALKRRSAPAKADSAPLQAQIATLSQAKTADETALAGAQADLARANAALTEAQAQKAQLMAAQAADAHTLDVYRAKNAQALQVARSLLKAYEHVTVADVLARKEPATGITRARIEQIEQTYADQIYDSRLDVTPRPPPAATASPPCPAPAPVKP